MLEPAMLHKEAIINGLKKRIYEDEISYYSGWNGYTIPNIPDEFDGCDYRYAILDGDKVIGYFCYTYDMHSKCLRNFGLYSFDRYRCSLRDKAYHQGISATQNGMENDRWKSR